MTSVCKIRCLGFVFVGRLIEIQMFTKVGTCITISNDVLNLKTFLLNDSLHSPILLDSDFLFLGQVGRSKQNTQLNFHKGAIRHSDLHTLRCLSRKKNQKTNSKTKKKMNLFSIARHRGCLKTEAGDFLKLSKVPADWSSSLKCFGSFFSTFILFFFGGGNHRTYFSLTTLYMMPKHPWCIGWDVGFCGLNPKHDPPSISPIARKKNSGRVLTPPNFKKNLYRLQLTF